MFCDFREGELHGEVLLENLQFGWGKSGRKIGKFRSVPILIDSSVEAYEGLAIRGKK